MFFNKKKCMGWVIGDRYSKISLLGRWGALDLPEKNQFIASKPSFGRVLQFFWNFSSSIFVKIDRSVDTSAHQISDWIVTYESSSGLDVHVAQHLMTTTTQLARLKSPFTIK